MAKHADVVIVTDPRFMGGTASSLLVDVAAFLEAGLTVAVVLFRADDFFRSDDKDNPKLTALADDPRLVQHPDTAQAVFFHNPQIFGPQQIAHLDTTFRVARCDHVFMVAHHPPFLGNGALTYDPLSVSSALARRYGKSVCWLPVSGLVRSQLYSFRPLLKVSPLDWVNSFDTQVWPEETSRMTSAELVIGRHGRPHADKWPDDAVDISASLPGGPLTKVRVLGADEEFFDERAVDTTGWEILPFGAMSPQRFLSSLDVFCYFHSANWREAFGRTVAEAMLSGVRCVLDPALRPTFGEHAIYCRPSEVASVLDTIRQDPRSHRVAATKAGDWCRGQFSTSLIAPRLKELLTSPPKRWNAGPRSTSAAVALRKLIGFHRRNRGSVIP